MPADSLEQRLARALEVRAERFGLAAGYLFGSTARGEAGPGSDLDVAVLYDVDPPATLEGLGLDLQAELEDELGTPVDIVALNHAPVDLIVRVLRDGHLLLDRDHGRRIRFEIRSRNEFWDLEPYLRLYRRQGAVAS